MILPCINTHVGDEKFVHQNLDLAFKLDGRQEASVMVASDDKGVLDRVYEHASKCFTKVERFQYDLWKGDRQWPIIQNYAWQKVAYWMDVATFTPNPSGWLWWESDAIPIRPGWLKAISEAHEAGKKPFSGVACSDWRTPFYQNGVGVWPMKPSDWLANTPAMFVRNAAFDREAGAAVKGNQTPLNHLMIHDVKPFGGSVGTAFIDRSEVDDLLAANPRAVFYHGCADGSLTKLLLGQTIEPVSPMFNGPHKYSISVICYNNLDFTRRCLSSILLHSDNYELIVTDNNSTDGTAKYLKLLQRLMGERLTVITNDENKGFNEPSNVALEQAKGEFFVLINNDIEVCKGWLDGLSRRLESQAVALVGLSGTCQSITKDFHGSAGGQLEYIEGSCCMGRTEQLRRVGLFSSYLKFAYYEDVDLSLRLREAGFQLATVDLPMKHHTRGNTSVMVEKEGKIPLKQYVEENKAAMKKRWGHYIATRSFTPPSSILIKRRGANGDVLLLTPVIRALKTKWPNTEIHVATDCGQVLQGNPLVKSIQPYSRIETRGHVVFDLDLSYEARPEVHIVEAYSDVCGVEVEKDWKLEIKPDFSKENDSKQIPNSVVVHMGPSWISKTWKQDKWASLLGALLKDSFRVVFYLDSLNTTPQQTAALISRNELFIGIDSFPAHIAQAVGTPSVVLFGSTNPECILHPTANVIAVQGDQKKVKCIGEHGRRTKPLTNAPPCRGECMESITVDMVLEAVEKVLGKRTAVAA